MAKRPAPTRQPVACGPCPMRQSAHQSFERALPKRLKVNALRDLPEVGTDRRPLGAELIGRQPAAKRVVHDDKFHHRARGEQLRLQRSANACLQRVERGEQRRVGFGLRIDFFTDPVVGGATGAGAPARTCETRAGRHAPGRPVGRRSRAGR